MPTLSSRELTTQFPAPPTGDRLGAGDRTPGVPFWRIFSVHAVLDQEDRPLGEHRAPPDLEGAAPTQLKQCPYAGSRYKHNLPMNVSGLRQVAQHWDEIAAGLAFLHHCFRGSRPGLSLPQLWRLLVATAVLPPYLLHRARPERGPWRPEAFVAAIYKASLGVKYMLEQQLLPDLLAGRSVHRPADAEALSAVSESSGVLVGLEQVCAAPANMIADTLRALVHGAPDSGIRSALARIIGPVEPFRVFTRAACDLYATFLVFSTFGARAQISLEKQLGVSAPTTTSRESGPLVQGLSVEVSMSLTIGMRRICWPFARLDELRCVGMLKTFCEITSEEDAPYDAVAALRALSDPEDAARNKRNLARRLECELAPRIDNARAPGSLAAACELLASYFHLEKAVHARLAQIERELNDALERDRAPGGTPASAFAGYCAVSVWKTASEGLGVHVESDPESGTLRCGERLIRAGHPSDHARR